MPVYYNEIDPYAAAWLRNLIAAGHIAPGDVDIRSIEDVTPQDLAGYAQCHFFAGIGVWSYALRMAGWPDDRRVWTGSCPCQPFSAAGKGAGAADERHLWPAWHHLIGRCRPSVLFGEQVEAAIKHDWLDLVQADLEGLGYAVGAVVLPAAGVGAPHIRHRLWFVADNNNTGHAALQRNVSADVHIGPAGWRAQLGLERSGANGELADYETRRRGEVDSLSGRGDEGVAAQRSQRSECGGHAGELGDSEQPWLEGHARHGDYPRGRSFAFGSVAASGAVGGFWRDAHVVYCRDGKLRPVESGSFPLAHGAPARVGRLRAYGNAIVAPLAAEFIAAYMECRP